MSSYIAVRRDNLGDGDYVEAEVFDVGGLHKQEILAELRERAVGWADELGSEVTIYRVEWVSDLLTNVPPSWWSGDEDAYDRWKEDKLWE